MRPMAGIGFKRLMVVGLFSSIAAVVLAQASVFGAGYRAHHAHLPMNESREASPPSADARVQQPPELLIRLGRAKLAQGRSETSYELVQEAADLFARVVADHPHRGHAWLGLASAQNALHAHEDALMAARHAGRLLPGNDQVYAVLGDSHLALGHLDEAELIYRQRLASAITLDTLSRMALLYEARSDYHNALTAMRDACQAGILQELKPATLAWCQERLGDLYLEHGDLHQAGRAYGQALLLAPNADGAAVGLALVSALSGNKLEARAQIASITERSQEPAHWVWAARVMDFAAPGEAEAQACLKRAEHMLYHAMESEQAGHIHELVALWMGKRQHAERAMVLAESLLQRSRTPRAYEQALWARYLAGQATAADKLADTALQLAPAKPSLLARVAVVKAELGRYSEARVLFQRAHAGNAYALLAPLAWPADADIYAHWQQQLAAIHDAKSR